MSEDKNPSLDDIFEELAQKIEKATRHVSGGSWCDYYEPFENRDYFARMVRNFAKTRVPKND